MTDIVLSQNQTASGNSTNLANTTLITNFNVTPYFDDYDPNKQYYRILYKPGYAVQARELTQMQSMLQSQIYRFGSHVFNEGSIVLPGGFTIRAATNGTLNKGPGNPVDYVKISTVDNTNTTINIENFKNQTLKGATSNISAYVIDVLPSDGTTQNTNTLYVNYLSASPDNPAVRTFQEGETLTTNVGTSIVLTSAVTSNVVGKSSWFQIEEGVFFAKQHFIYFPTQSVVLDRYSPLPSCQVGFYVSEKIVDYTEDASLLDPALGATNYAAPGADRLKLVSDLEVVALDATEGPPNFVPLLTIKDGIIQTIHEKTSYNILGDVLAQRTNDEAGDYVIKGLTTQVSEHLNIQSPIPNYGRYPASGTPAGNSQLLVATIDPGIGYVKGYGVQKFDRTDVEFDKPQQYNNVVEQLAVSTMGSYLKVNEFVGTWELNKGNRVQFYDIPQARVTNFGSNTAQKWSGGSQSGNNIGSAIVTNIQYSGGTPGYDAIYNIYFTDIQMNGSNTFSNVASLYLSSSPYASSGADVYGATYPSTANTALFEVSKAPLLYYVGSDWTKTVKDTLGANKTIYYFNQTVGVASTIYMANTGTITPTISLGTNQELPYGTTTLSGLADASMLNDFIVTMGQTFNIGPLWSSSVSATGNQINGSNTYFTHLNVGDKVQLAGQSGKTWYITAIANDRSMTVNSTVPASVTANLIFKAYETGDIINMAGVGVTAGAQRTITTTPTQFTINLKETLPVSPPVTISYKVGSTQTPAATKTLNPNRYVIISCAAAGTTGPFCLGFSDVYSINSITLKSSSAPGSLGDGTDVTKYFTLDNGQKDTVYDLAYIKKSAGLTLNAGDFLLISLNYFSPNFSGAGSFFAVDSYPIDDVSSPTPSNKIRTEEIPVYYSASNGLRYDLKNQLDFRPVKSLTAADATTIGLATVNPSTSSTSLVYSGSGINFPTPDSQLVYDYSYYLGRIDIVCINKDGSIVVVQGTPSTTPVTPIPSDNQMIIAIINTTPYPSISPAYGNVLKRSDLAVKVKKASNRVYTMRDIGILDKRITNLEYYTSLTLLEKNALNLQILDQNGLNRFKNGIFVDTFKDNSLSAAGVDGDYRIVTDPRELSIRPLFSTDSVGYDYISGSGVTVSNNNLVMLNYTEVQQYQQPRVTDVRELEKGTFFFQGSMSLLPAQDVWVDVTQLPDEYVNITANGALLDIGVSQGNAPGDVLTLAKVTPSAGIYKGDTITLSNISNTINVGDRIIGATSGNSGNSLVYAVVDQPTNTQYQMVNSAYQLSESVSVYNTAGYLTATATVSAISNSFTIVLGDRLYGNTSQGNGNNYVISVSIGNSEYQTSNVGYIIGEYVSVYNVAGILKATANVSNVVVAATIATLPGVIANSVNKTAAVQKNLINTEWGNWQSSVTGYNLYRGDGAAKVFVGYFTSADAAKQAAAAWTTTQNGGTATLETVYNNTRTGTDYFANFSADQGAGDNKVISTNAIPYIRPQKLAIQVTNLKGYSKMNAFFDGVNMTSYCTPLSQAQYTSYVAGKPIPANSDGTFPVEGNSLIVDDFGALYFLLRIPSEAGAPQFRCGQRKIVVIDNTNLDANSLDLTQDTSTSATAVFFAQGTAETLQRTVYSTKGYMVTTGPDSQAYTSQTDQVLPNTWVPPPKGHCCFDPNAKVLMADCTWKAIKDVVEGDKVIGDNGVVNTVQKNKTIGVGGRKMLKLKGSTFYTTDDHLFLTKKGWKTWRPDIVLRDSEHTTNGFFLIGDNRVNSIDKDDFLKTVKIVDGKVVEEFTPYEPIEAEAHDFAPDYLVHDLTLDGNMTYIVDGYVVHNCCVAYSVLIRAPDDEEGIFCTGFNFYVARKSKTRGLWAEIGVLDNSGQVSSDRVPGSQVYLTNSDIPVSNTGGDNPVQIRFKAPVFLFNKKGYSFIIHSDSPNAFNVDPDTQIWISRLGQTDKLTGTSVTNREGTGQFWQTTNNVNWYEIGDVDLKMEVYRANFTPTTTSFILGNKPVEKLHLSHQTQSFKSLVGDHFTSGDQITLSGVSGTVSVGNRISGNLSLSNANSYVMVSLGGNKYQMANNKYIQGEFVSVYNANNYVVATGNITVVANSTAVLSYIDESQINIYSEWAQSTGGFAANQTLTLVGAGGQTYKANVDYISDYNYSTVSLQPKVLDFVKTDIGYEMDTFDLNATTSSGYRRINDQDTTYLNTEKQIYARTNEVTNIAGAQSNKVRVTFNTISNYVSPVLDLDHTHTLAIDNLINSNTYGEGIVYTNAGNGTIDPAYSGNTAASGGQALNKYISQTITLADGQDAEDLQVILACYRPPGTDVLVYAKLLNGQDPDSFKTKNWIRMNKVPPGDTVYSSLSDRNNFRDFTYVLPPDIMTADNGGVQYTNSQGMVFTMFKYYAIKIVLVADDPAIVPRASDLRAIALQM